MTTTLPNRIEVTIQEEDRLNAENYEDNSNCIMATALKRMGYNHDTRIWVCPTYLTIGTEMYKPEHISDMLSGSHGLHNYFYKGGKPFYAPEVVGKKITLIRQ